MFRVSPLKRVFAQVWKQGHGSQCCLGVAGPRRIHSCSVLGAKNPSSKHKNIRCVIFDMGGVILPNPLGVFQEFEVSNNLPEGTLLSVIKDRGDKGAWALLEKGAYTSSEFVEHFGQECSEKVGYNVNVSDLLPKFHYNPSVKPHPQIIDLIQCVRAEGFLTALLTNNWLIHPTHSFLPLDRSLFDVIIESAVVKCRKPDPRIYEICLKQLRMNPQQAVFLDDIGINLKSAKQLGIDTIKVTNPDQAVQDLEKLLGLSLQGYLKGTISVPERLRFSRENLTTYLTESLNLPHPGTLPHIRLFKHGMSNPTFYLKFGDNELVLRKKPPGKLLPSAHAVDREFRVMKAMEEQHVPVPPMLGMCDDTSVLGTEFYVMGLVPGVLYLDALLPNKSDNERHNIYTAMIDALCKIHSVDIGKANLDSFGKKDNYMKRNFSRWMKQYENSKTEEIPAMNEIIKWISENLPEKGTTTVVHGDFRLDNLIYSDKSDDVLAVIDWELSTLGDPLSDLATCCFMYYVPSRLPILPGLSDVALTQYGIPSIDQILTQYCSTRNIPPIENWNFYVIYTFFRFAAILQGVYKRATVGQSTNTQAESTGKYVKLLAQLGVQLINNPKRKPQAPSLSEFPVGRRAFSTSASSGYRQTPISPQQHQPGANSPNLVKSPMPLFVASLSPRVQGLHEQVKEFVSEHVLPLEPVFLQHLTSDKRWTPFEPVEKLKVKAKQEGLWNLFMPLNIDTGAQYGAGLTNVEYTFLCELMGTTQLAPEVFNCSAPDTGNMEVLVKYGTEDQKKKWLTPLLDGTIRSCFAMTEPQVASSDATNIESSIVRDGNHFVINGRKWWTSGAMDPRCRICIFMGKTNPKGPKHAQQSMILVPMDTEGVNILRPLTVFGYDDAPVGHGELVFQDVRVPVENLLLGEGRGFEIAQGRLGPGRIHHCMRLIGMAERALSLMITRSSNRVAFGKPLSEQGLVQAAIAESRIDIDQARLLVLKAAHMMDTVGNKAAAGEIAMIKVVAPNMAARVIDRAIQIHGGAGLSSDFPLASMYSWARILRLADGPDEVHLQTVAKLERKKHR
ncbi:acyl-CoA dehydrogenase family member 10 [Octopus sinensis]|uniref:Acyl-CoA dehydrogenase family member 10 n=1 Tax=Octopus sinensis TaxID=2607531 RepID=A0A6P7TUW3_9MOLL|nr:acyl-CoA dehydrogenase family member 10 [Octopus sinensis]XP_029653127.1 acyl-CoA dehydrogenase family member 10 [Octopus sinensis]